MNLTKWNPFRVHRGDFTRELDRISDRFQRLFELAPLLGNGEKELLTSTEWTPLVDITEDDKQYSVKAELPETKREDIKVSVENGMLSITGERKCEKEEKTTKQHRIERSYGRFERSFSLPDDANGAKVTAEYKDGVLNVRIPKDETAKPKAIDVKVA